MATNEVGRQDPKLELDINGQRNFVKFYKKLGEKPASTVLFFERDNNYSVHGNDDSLLLSKFVYKTTAYIRQMLAGEPDALSYVMMNKHNFELAVRELLLVRNFRIKVYVRDDDGNWRVEYRGSPGNLLQFEDILFDNKEMLVGNLLLSLQLTAQAVSGAGTQRKLGVAAVEQNDCIFQLLEFLDDDFYTELEATIVLLSPKECLLPSFEGEYAGLKLLLERNGVMVTLLKKSTASASDKNDLLQDLKHLLRFEKGQQEDAAALPETQLQLAMEALHLAVKYLNLSADAANLGHYKLQQLHLQRFVHLDAAAVSALNILPKASSSQHANMACYRWQSILGVLDHTMTPQGRRLLTQWLKQPLRNQQILNDRHNVVQCLLESPDCLDMLHGNLLKRLPDMLMLTKKLMRRKATLMDLFRIYQIMLRTPKIVTELEALQNATINSMLCEAFKSDLTDLSGLKQMVEQVLDFEAIDTGEYLVKASFDEQLLQIHQRMTKLLKKMKELQVQAVEDLQLERGQVVRLENIAQHGYHFRIPLKEDHFLRGHKDYKLLDVVKSGVRFTSDKLSQYCEEYVGLCKQYEEQQKSIVEEIIKVAIGYACPLFTLNNQIAQLDCLVSFAMAARTAPIPYVRPQMLAEGAGILKLEAVRHPCLELQEHVQFIANDVEFQKDETNMYIITGPNMGGKSTYIRSVGTAVLMAHVGSFVPCSKATISMVDSILGRVGASDNIIKGLSTFMVEMIESSGIVRTATDKSLVIIDELGRGTSTYEGCGIAWSIAEHLVKETKCFTLFATHFHEITSLADSFRTVRNSHMAAVADDENFTLLYQVRPGVMAKSFGIQVAKLADFPKAVVKHAEQVYSQLEDEHTQKQTTEDKVLLEQISEAIDKLCRTGGNDANINEQDLTTLVERFTTDIRKLDSEYMKTVASTVASKQAELSN